MGLRYLHTHVQSRTLFTVERGGSDSNFHRRMNAFKKNVVYKCKRLFSLEKGGYPATCYNMDEPRGHCAK